MDVATAVDRLCPNTHQPVVTAVKIASLSLSPTYEPGDSMGGMQHTDP